MSDVFRRTRDERGRQLGAEAVIAHQSDVMEAMVAAYALMAHADGEVADAERHRFFSVLRQNPAMAVFSRQEIAGEVAEHEANFRFDPEVAQVIARERVAGIAEDRQAASLVISACRELIPADGVAHPAEYRQLADIKALLNHAEFLGRGAVVTDSGTLVRPPVDTHSPFRDTPGRLRLPGVSEPAVQDLDPAAAWDARVARSLAHLPGRLRGVVEWLRVPSRRGLRRMAGVLFILGGLLSILPVLGLWMLPLGLALLAEDDPRLKRRLEGASLWMEGVWHRIRRRRP